jgi:uncharacterized sulfatase
LLCRGRASFPGGQIYRHPVITLDVAATAVELSGLPRDPELDGVNLIPFLSGREKGAPHDALMWRWISQAAIREGKWKLLRGGEREYLFDLDADKEEKKNLLAANPEIANHLRNKLSAWAGELKPPAALFIFARICRRAFRRFVEFDSSTRAARSRKCGILNRGSCWLPD